MPEDENSFKWKDLSGVGKFGLLTVKLYSYESPGPYKRNGKGYPYVGIELSMFIDSDRNSGMLVQACGQEWKIECDHAYYNEISLSNIESHIGNLEPGKFYCLDTGKILDLSKIENLPADK